MKSPIPKARLIQEIVTELKSQLTRLMSAANSTREEATHEDSQAEDKYDTRGLEASYLAAGQTRQIEDLAEAIRQYGGLAAVLFRAEDAVDVGALVEVRSESDKQLYFIGPCAGGTEIHIGKRSVLVLTPQSPLGVLLTGRKKGDRMKWKRAGETQTLTISTVW